MRQEDKRLLREELIGLLEAYQKNTDDPKVKQLAREIHGRHKGQVQLLDADTAKAVQLTEDIAYKEDMPPLPQQRVTDVLAELRASSR